MICYSVYSLPDGTLRSELILGAILSERSGAFHQLIRGAINGMSTAIWGEQEPLTTVEKYPLPLLKKLLQEMIRQFGASGGCMALYDESIGLMNIRLHLRLRSTAPVLVG